MGERSETGNRKQINRDHEQDKRIKREMESIEKVLQLRFDVNCLICEEIRNICINIY